MNGLKSFLNMQFFFNRVKGIASDNENQHISHFYDARNLKKLFLPLLLAECNCV